MKTKEQLAEEKYPYLPNGCDFTVENTHDDLRSIERSAFITGYEAAQQWISVEDQTPNSQQIVNVVVAISDTGVRYRTTAYFIPEKSVLASDFLDEDHSDGLEVYDESIDDYWVKEGWFEYQTMADINYYITDEVTHWLPLPKLPTE